MKRKELNTHSLSQDLTLTLTVTPCCNHYTTSNFGRPCTQFRLMYTRHTQYAYCVLCMRSTMYDVAVRVSFTTGSLTWCKCDVMRFIRDCLHGSLPKIWVSLVYSDSPPTSHTGSLAITRFETICKTHTVFPIFTSMAVPGRNRTLFCCVLRSDYHVCSTLGQNFC